MMKISFFILVSSLLLNFGCARRSKDNILVLSNGEKIVLAYSETLTTAMASEPPSLDWVKAHDAESSWVIENIMDGLVSFDLKDPELRIQPGLATNWTPKQKGKVWILSLRKGVKWSDGKDFHAQQVVDGWQRLLDPALAMTNASFLFSLKNAQKYNSQVIKDFSKVGVRILSDHLIRVELEEPIGFFPMLLAHHSTYPVRKDLIEKYGERWTEAENIVTLGPFNLKYWKHDSEILLERNNSYYGKAPTIRYVLFYMIERASTALRLFDRGRLDFIREVPTTEIKKLKNRPEYNAKAGLRLYYFGFKVKKKPFDNKIVRRAFAHAIDKQEVVNVVGGGQVPLKSWFPKGMFGYSPDIGLKFDLKKARELLALVGFRDGKDFPKVIIGFNNDEKHKIVAENIQSQIKKNLGIKVELKSEEWKSYLNHLKTDSSYSIFRLGWVADYPDPNNFTEMLLSYSASNRTGWSLEKVDQLFKEARSEIDLEKRRQLYRDAEKILMEDELPAIPIFVDVNATLLNQRVKDFSYNSMDKYLFKNVRLK